MDEEAEEAAAREEEEVSGAEGVCRSRGRAAAPERRDCDMLLRHVQDRSWTSTKRKQVEAAARGFEARAGVACGVSCVVSCV